MLQERMVLLGNELKKYREKSRLGTKYQGAKAMNINWKTLDQWERGIKIPRKLYFYNLINTYLITRDEANALEKLWLECIELSRKP